MTCFRVFNFASVGLPKMWTHSWVARNNRWSEPARGHKRSLDPSPLDNSERSGICKCHRGANSDAAKSGFHNCPVGWGCRVVNDNLKVVHQLEANGIEVFDHGSGANLGASIAAAFADNEPWFGYYWGPTAVLGKYKMTKVDIGPVDPKQHKINQKKDADPAKIGVSGFPSAPVLNAITAEFAKREPEVAAFIGKMQLLRIKIPAAMNARWCTR